MKLTHALLFAGAAAGAYYLGSSSAASVEAPVSPEAFMGRYAQSPVPTKHHEFLEKLAGTWHSTTKVSMGPGMEMEMTGVLESYMGCNGTWLIGDFKSDVNGMEFQGHWIIGWDGIRKEYSGMWLDAARQGIDPFVGRLDEDGVLVSEGLVPNPMMPPAKIKARSWIKIEGDTFTYVEKLDDGKGGWKPWMSVMHTPIHEEHAPHEGEKHDHDRMHEHGDDHEHGH